MKKSSWALIVGVVALIVAISSFFVASGGSHPAGTTANKTATAGIYIAGLGFGVGSEQSFKTVFNSSGQLTLSSVGSAVTGLNFGTCTIFPYSTTIVASSTAQVDCQAGASGVLTALAGITSGDKVFVTLASTTPTIQNGLIVENASASTTSGFITLRIANATGNTFTWTSTSTSSLSYLALR